MLVTTHHMDEAQECDCLVVMADGRVVAAGEVAGIVGSARVTVVETSDWAGAFEAIERSGKVAGLAGRTLRVPGASPEAVGETLAAIPATVYAMPATRWRNGSSSSRGPGQKQPAPRKQAETPSTGTGTDAPPFLRSRWIFRHINAKKPPRS